MTFEVTCTKENVIFTEEKFNCQKKIRSMDSWIINCALSVFHQLFFSSSNLHEIVTVYCWQWRVPNKCGKNAHFSVRCHMSPLTSICSKVSNLRCWGWGWRQKFCGWKLGLKKCFTERLSSTELFYNIEQNDDDETRLNWMSASWDLHNSLLLFRFWILHFSCVFAVTRCYLRLGGVQSLAVHRIGRTLIE